MWRRETVLCPKSRCGMSQWAMLTLALPPDKIADFCRRHGIRSLALFGSFLHGDAGEDSDVDLLFEMEPERRIGLLALLEMAQELSA